MRPTTEPSLSRRIGIVRTSSIGDVVLATVCLQALRTLKWSDRVTWFGSFPSMDLLKQAYPEVHFVEIKKQDGYRDLAGEFSKLQLG